MKTLLLTCSIFLVSTLASQAVEYRGISMSGYMGLEMRAFVDDPQYSDQLEGLQSSYILNPEFSYDSDSGLHQYSFIPYFRFDGRDDERTHFDLREAYWRYVADDWEFLAGMNKVFWGVVESRHLIDIINQDDLVENLDGEDKLGQPMINLSLLKDWGNLSLYILPGFRERTYGGSRARLRGPVAVHEDALYESGAEEKHIDYALRYSHYWEDWDFGAYYFNGTGREPTFVGASDGQLKAYYELIQQGGVDLQFTKEAWLWKFEGMAREGQGKSFAAASGGVEYTFYQVNSSDADLGMLLEYHVDGRDVEAPSTTYDNDVFLGLRLAMNDVDGSEALLGVLTDAGDSSQLLFVEAQRRLNDNYLLEFEGRFFENIDSGNTATVFENDSFLSLRLSRYF